MTWGWVARNAGGAVIKILFGEGVALGVLKRLRHLAQGLAPEFVGTAELPV
jgi:hypothetical protein